MWLKREIKIALFLRQKKGLVEIEGCEIQKSPHIFFNILNSNDAFEREIIIKFRFDCIQLKDGICIVINFG